MTQYSYFGIFSLLTLGIVGLPIPDEGVLAFAGYLVYKGELPLLPTVAAAFLGSSCGITLSYGLGRTVGIYLIHRWGSVIHISADQINRTHNWFERIGRWSLVFGYFVPGVRHLTALVAGAAKLEVPVFALFAYGGAFIWSVTFITLGYILGEKWAWVSGELQGHLLLGSGIGLGLIAMYLLIRQRKQAKRKADL